TSDAGPRGDPMIRPLRRLTALLPSVFMLLALALAATSAVAQERGLEIDIIGGNASATPIAVVPFGGSAGDTDVAAVIRADLERSGQFRALPEQSMVERPTSGGEVNYPTWRALNQDYLLVGRIVDGGGGSFRTEYELFDVAKQE